MRLILCASNWSLVEHWSNLDNGCTISKGQNELLELLKQTLELPLVILEEKLYENLEPIILLAKEINPATIIFIIAQKPTFARAQEVLGLGANAYSNQYLSKKWFDEAIKSLQNGENWIYPSQESGDKSLTKVGRVVEIGQDVQNDRHIANGSVIYLNEDIWLKDINSSITIEFDDGDTLDVKGKTLLHIDKSVATNLPEFSSSVTKHAFSLKKADAVPMDRPFYINVGSESLVSPSSRKLDIKPDGVFIRVTQFHVEESDYELSFADIPNEQDSVRLRGEIEEYEIFNSKILKDSMIVNDLVYGRDGGRVVYAPVKMLEFLNAKVDLCYSQEGRESIKLGDFIKFNEDKNEFEGVSIVVQRHIQGRDYLLFDKGLVPKDVRFSYMLDDKKITLKFFGKSKHYGQLLKSLCHESQSQNSLYVRVEALLKGVQIPVFDGLI